MSKKLLDNYIFLLIADSSISNHKKTKFATYNGYVNYIHGEMKAKRIKNISTYIYPIIEEVSLVFGISKEESSKYVAIYFSDKKWKIYHSAVRMARNHFNIFLSA